ncbi:2Fe-2S iron-sulfur cluster binding domain-containing protein [Xylophilus sp. Kf1]|nr:2Fe-2S iron-sulfur cluster binding domain-containing protein [Xylophilus sp. Kf1]
MELTPTRLRIEPHGWQVEVPAGSTLLAAAEAAGVVLPSSCRNGTCRACLCQSTAGAVYYDIAWPGLSREEKAEGWLLPCVARAREDVVLVVPAAQRA